MQPCFPLSVGTQSPSLIRSPASNGVRRCSVGHVLVVAVVMIALPLLILFGAAWKTRGVVQGLYASHLELELEAANYRVAIEALTRQMGSQQSTLADLSVNSGWSSASARLNPAAATSVVRSRPGGGERGANVAVDRWAVREALAKSGHTRTVAEGADAPVLASGWYPSRSRPPAPSGGACDRGTHERRAGASGGS